MRDSPVPTSTARSLAGAVISATTARSAPLAAFVCGKSATNSAQELSRVRRRYDKVAGFIAYFQPATNTYAPVDQLAEVFELALSLHAGSRRARHWNASRLRSRIGPGVDRAIGGRLLRFARVWNANDS